MEYFGARYYWAVGGRWWSVDPQLEKYPCWSPYVYTLNNPIRYYDPDGSQVRSDSPGLINKKVYMRTANIRLQKYGYAEPLSDPRFQSALIITANTYGPTTLDVLSLGAMGFGQFQIAAGLSYISASWTLYLSIQKNNPDFIISFSTAIGQESTKSIKARIALQLIQLGYDFYFSGRDYNKEEGDEKENDNDGVALPDNTRVNYNLLQNVAYDLGWYSVDWNEIREIYNKGKE